MYPQFEERPVVINVSGLRYEIRRSTLNKFPHTLLGSLEREIYWDHERKEYFFERHRHSFETIFYYYLSDGLINIPTSLSPEILAEELRFFKIGNEAMIARLTGQQLLDTFQAAKTNQTENIYQDATITQKIWLTFSDPGCSKAGRYMHYFDTIIIIIAITAQCVETLPEFDYLRGVNRDMFSGNVKWDMWLCFLVELLCIAWFTLDLLIRLLLCPDKCAFFKSVMNWIDFLSVLPFYMNLVLTKTISAAAEAKLAGDEETTSRDMDALMILRITRLLRVLRIARVFKMSRKFDGLFALGYALKSGASELMLLAVLLSTCVILFSSLVFFANESDPDSPFSSVIDAFWWSVVTMSTVGYGDQVPTTLLGKLIGVVTALTGILVIALPYPIIVSRFNRYYELQKKMKSSSASRDLIGEPGEEEWNQPGYDGVIFRGNREEYKLKDISNGRGPHAEANDFSLKRKMSV